MNFFFERKNCSHVHQMQFSNELSDTFFFVVEGDRNTKSELLSIKHGKVFGIYFFFLSLSPYVGCLTYFQCF